ncbi:MAG: SDR family NAD(P)-dependent oxidoreductase, partial [Anaerolineae bacterium]
FCLAYAEAGADVVVAELNPDTGVQTAQEVQALGRRSSYIKTDVRSRASVYAMIAQAVQEFGRIDILMNNAGITKWCPAEDVSEADWREVMQVNLDGVFYGCQAAAKQMMAHGNGGVITNIASMSGFIVNYPQDQASYNTSKAAVIHLTKSLAAEWADQGIRVNAIAPGYMGTSMAQPFFDDPKYGGIWIPAIPMKRPGSPEELGPLAVFLASEASSYMTGTTVVIDGGYTIL